MFWCLNLYDPSTRGPNRRIKWSDVGIYRDRFRTARVFTVTSFDQLVAVHHMAFCCFPEDVQLGLVEADPNLECEMWMQDIWDIYDEIVREKQIREEEERLRQQGLTVNPNQWNSKK